MTAILREMRAYSIKSNFSLAENAIMLLLLGQALLVPTTDVLDSSAFSQNLFDKFNLDPIDTAGAVFETAPMNLLLAQ